MVKKMTKSNNFPFSEFLHRTARDTRFCNNEAKFLTNEALVPLGFSRDVTKVIPAKTEWHGVGEMVTSSCMQQRCEAHVRRPLASA